jgi:UDP-2,3-diacylglucosamine pyrophosphatase LpxH
MSKIVILGDCHFGARGDSVDFLCYFEKFYTEVFFPYLLENNIKTVIQLGDLFERRKYINFNSLRAARRFFFSKFDEYGIKLITLLGNHDVSYKNTLQVNSATLLLNEYISIDIYDKFGTVEIEGVPVDIIPWLCEENILDILESIEASKSKICFGHFEIGGFEMDRGNIFKGGTIEKTKLRKYDMVISGHFHHKSDDGHIFYLGTPYEITWADYNDPRGFHVFDVDTRDMEFIRNPYQMFHKIEYDDSVQDLEYWNAFDFISKKDTYIKIITLNKKDHYLFDTVIDNFYKAGAYDIGIVEDFTKEEEVEADSVDQAEDTLTTLMKFIDSQKFDVNVEKLKRIMREIYIEALNVEKTE